MKNIPLVAVGVLLSIVIGCAGVKEDAGKALNFAQALQTLKTGGCDALPDSSKRLLVLLIKTRIPEYPMNGICDQQWVRDVLLKQIDKLESTDVYNQSTSLGYKADRRHGSLAKSDSINLSIGVVTTNSDRAQWLPNRSGVYSKVRTQFYASCIKAHQSSCSDTRLHLHRFV